MNVCTDIENYIINVYLDDKDVIRYLKICKNKYTKLKIYQNKNPLWWSVGDKINFILKHIYVRNINDIPLLNSITHLTFSNYFNKPVDNLPQSIIYLTFSNQFNKPVDNLPQSITHLIFGKYFNQPVDNLPQSITHLTFGEFFNQPVDRLP